MTTNPTDLDFFDLYFKRLPTVGNDIPFGTAPSLFDLNFYSTPYPDADLVFGMDRSPELNPLTEFDLLFKNLPVEGYDLLFGEPIEGEEIPSVEGGLSLKILTPRLSGAGSATRYIYTAVADIPLPLLQFSGQGIYDVDTFRGFRASKRMYFQESKLIVDTTSQACREAELEFQHTTSTFFTPTPIQMGISQRQVQPYKVSTYTTSWAQDAEPIKERTSVTLASAISLPVSQLSVTYEAAEPLSVQSLALLENSVIVGLNLKRNFEMAQGISASFGSSSHLAVPFNQTFLAGFESAEYPVNAVIVPVPPPLEEDKGDSHDIVIKCLASIQENEPTYSDIIFNKPCYGISPPPQVQVDYTEPYFVINSIALINVETEEVIQATSLDFSTDLASFAWSGSITVGESEVSKLTSPSNNPVKVALTFNGNLAVFVVQSISKAATFNKASYKVVIISPTVLLDSPYSRVDSKTVTEDTAPQTLIDTLLLTPLTGISLDWKYLSALDWVVAANTFSYQELSPIKAIGKLLEGSAAFMSSSLDGASLVIKRKRANEFWEPALNPSLLEAAFTTSLSYTQERHRNFDAVYVISGLNQTLGITGHVIRDGGAGTELAPQVIAPTLTSPSAVMDAGKYVLGNAGVIETRTLSQPIIEGGDLFCPADLVSFVVSGTTYIGTVLSTSISLKFNSQYQNFVVEVVKGYA